MSEQQTARSYKGAILDDNAIISINLRWLFQVFVLVAGLVYSYTEITQSIADNERRVIDLDERVDELKSIHNAEIEEIQKWYKLNIFGKDKRRK